MDPNIHQAFSFIPIELHVYNTLAEASWVFDTANYMTFLQIENSSLGVFILDTGFEHVLSMFFTSFPVFAAKGPWVLLRTISAV